MCSVTQSMRHSPLLLTFSQSAANDVKAKVQSIEASQNKINQVRQTMDKVLRQLS